MNPETPKQRSISIPIEGGSPILVRRMYWKKAKDFLKLLAKHIAASAADLDDTKHLLARLPEIITSTDELVTFLMTNSTDLNDEALDKLDLVQAAQVLEAAVTLNLGDDLKNSLAVIGEALARLMPALKKTSGEPSTSP